MNRLIQRMKRTKSSSSFRCSNLILTPQPNLPIMITGALTFQSRTKKEVSLLNSVISNVMPDRGTVIDLSCGTGDLLIQLAPRIRKGVGLDHSEAQINHAVAKKQSKWIDHLYFLRMNGLKVDENIPGRFDLAIAHMDAGIQSDETIEQLLHKMSKKANRLVISTRCDNVSKIINNYADNASCTAEQSTKPGANALKVWVTSVA